LDDYVKVPSMYEPLIPLSVLQLDLLAPSIGGWNHYLAEWGIKVVNDDLGRDCIARGDARRLFEEKWAAEEKAREVAARNEQRAIELDQQRRAQIWKGVPASAMPLGALPASVMLQTAKDARPKRTSVLEDALDGGGLVMHTFSGEAEDE
jgi:hypothetical protein